MFGLINQRWAMGPISGIGVGSSGIASGDGIRRRRRHGGGNPRDPPPHFPPQRSQGATFLFPSFPFLSSAPITLFYFDDEQLNLSTGKGGRMLSINPGNSSNRHDQPQAQAFLLRSFLLFDAAQSQRSARFLLQLRELMRLVGSSSSQEKQSQREQLSSRRRSWRGSGSLSFTN